MMTFAILWRLLFWGWLASEILVGIGTRTKRSSGKVQDRGSLLILWLVITASITACQWISEVSQPNKLGGAQALKTTGVIVMLVALAIRWTSIFTLGKSFSSNLAIQDSQQITRTGLYRFVRHPSYLGLLLAFLAIGLHSRNWISFAVVLVPTIAALLYRIHVEEAALMKAFGDDYTAYAKATKRLIPACTDPRVSSSSGSETSTAMLRLVRKETQADRRLTSGSCVTSRYFTLNNTTP